MLLFSKVYTNDNLVRYILKLYLLLYKCWIKYIKHTSFHTQGSKTGGHFLCFSFNFIY